MSRLFLILVKKFGYEAARKMAPKFGIKQGVINKTAKQIHKRYMDARFAGTQRFMDVPNDMMLRAGGIESLKRMGRRGLGRTGPPQAPGRGLEVMRQRVIRGDSANVKNIDKLIANANKLNPKARGFMEPPYGKKEKALIAALLGGGLAVRNSDAFEQQVQSGEEYMQGEEY
jgi:hypothetical protein